MMWKMGNFFGGNVKDNGVAENQNTTGLIQGRESRVVKVTAATLADSVGCLYFGNLMGLICLLSRNLC